MTCPSNPERDKDVAEAASFPGSSRLAELPILIASLYYGFCLLIKRIRLSDGLATRVRIGMGSIFFALCEEDDCIVKQLANRLCIPKATMTGLLDAMEIAGLVERHPSPDDGRAIRVRLTPKARSLQRGMIDRHNRATAILQAGLSDKEVLELRRLLSHVLNNLRKDKQHKRNTQKANKE